VGSAKAGPGAEDWPATETRRLAKMDEAPFREQGSNSVIIFSISIIRYREKDSTT
jgi:hypothetical protein